MSLGTRAGLILALLFTSSVSAQNVSMRFGSARAMPGLRIEVPLLVSSPDPIAGVVAAFDWDGASGRGIEMRFDGAVDPADSGRFLLPIQSRVENEYAVVGIVFSPFSLQNFLSPGTDIHLGTLVLECQGSATTSKQIQFRDATYFVSPAAPMAEV